MLTQVEQVLTNRGWLDPKGSYDKTILLSRGNTVALRLSRRGCVGVYVKFSASACLCDEAARWSAAHANYPGLTPRVIGHVHEPGLDILVCEEMPHWPVSRVSLLEGRSGTLLRRDLQRYFSSMRVAHAPAHPLGQSPDRLIESMREYFRAHPLAPRLLPLLDGGVVDRIKSLPPMPQHGDLVLNNLGRAQGRLAMFDWEDFGLIHFPGADLCALLLSVEGGGSARADDLNRIHRTLPALAEEACMAMELALTDFEALFPFYVLVFRFLKRTYGAEIRDRLDGVMQEFSGCDKT